MSDRLRVVRIAGDGVGPELVAAGTRVVEALGVPVEWVDAEAGYGTYLARGVTAPAETVAAVRCCGAAVKGPFRTPNGAGSSRTATSSSFPRVSSTPARATPPRPCGSS